MVATVRHPVQLLKVVFLLCGAEARRRRYRTAGCADGSGRQRALGLKTITLAHAVALQPCQAFLLHVKLHQIKVVDIFQDQRAAGQLRAHVHLCAHVAVATLLQIRQRRKN